MVITFEVDCQSPLHDPILQGTWKYIKNIDFSMIIEKMVKQDGWRKKNALETAQFYRNFLYLNKKYSQHGVLPPSIDIDEFWHNHILDTKQYLHDCQQIFGYYLHHYPYLVQDHALNQLQLNQAFAQTQAFHQQEFGHPIHATRSKFAILRQGLSVTAKWLKTV